MKILLMLLPFWDPQIPPLGIICLKSFLQGKGYKLKTADANVEEMFRDIYGRYFDSINKFLPAEKRSNLYNIGTDVLRNHAMAHMNFQNKDAYEELVKILLFNTFYCEIDNGLINQLISLMDEFFSQLKRYLLAVWEAEKPDLLGLSVYSNTLPASLFCFKLAKETYPDMITVMGGGIFSSELSPGSANFQLFLKKTPYIDKIIVGEGELLFLEFLRGRLPGQQRVFTLQDIDNNNVEISSREILDFTDFDLEYYPQMASYTSRSCPFQCNFCVEKVYWGKYRKRQAKEIAKELHELYKRHGRQLFLMCDSLLNPVITDLANECIKLDTPMYWGGYLRVDSQVCDTRNTFLWRKGGFYRARLGIESGSPRVLDSMNKHINLDKVKEAVFCLANAGIKTTAMFVIGYPGETEEDFQQTLKLVDELRDYIYEADCNPFMYFETGQVNSSQWSIDIRRSHLYPEQSIDMLLLETWVLNVEPSRQERYDRVNRFIRHCRKLGVPNPYTLDEVYSADKRWKKLHKNAVPALLNFQIKENYLDECRNIKDFIPAKQTCLLDNHWEF